jgi:hypothetical protein
MVCALEPETRSPVQVGYLPLAQQLGHKYALTVDGNTASTRLHMVLATEQVLIAFCAQ